MTGSSSIRDDRIPQARLVGREREMEALEAVLASADDDPHPLLICGEPGFGKARLLGELERMASDPQTLVRRGPCSLDQLRARLAPLTPDPRETDVLKLVADGRINRNIASDLFISEQTGTAI